MAVPTAASTVSATTAGDPLAPNSTKSIFPSHMPGFQIDDLIPSEIKKLLGQTERQGMTLIPLSIYFNERGIAKMELGLAHGKRKVDKRATEKEKDWKRDQQRLLRTRSRAD